MNPWEACKDCRRLPNPGDRHSMCDGLTEDGEPTGVTCLDSSGEVLLRPPSEHPWDGPEPF